MSDGSVRITIPTCSSLATIKVLDAIVESIGKVENLEKVLAAMFQWWPLTSLLVQFGNLNRPFIFCHSFLLLTCLE